MLAHGASLYNNMNNKDFEILSQIRHSLFVDRNPLEHQKRHNMLFVMLTELVADYIVKTNRQIDRETISDLVEWAKVQTQNVD